MPQLDKLIILTQFKIFFFFFFICYFFFILTIIPKIYLSLRLRKEFFSKFVIFSLQIKSNSIFLFNEKAKFLFNFFELLDINFQHIFTENKIFLKSLFFKSNCYKFGNK